MAPRLLPLLALATLLPRPALGRGVSADVEMLRPSLGPTPGLEDARALPARRLLVGMLAQAESRPVVSYSSAGRREGIPVDTRLALQAGARFGLGRRLDVSAGLPVAWQDGTDDFGNADGAWLGDLELSARIGALALERAAIAPRLEVALPTGAEHAWMGEGVVRPGAGVAAEASPVGPLRLVGDVATRWHADAASPGGLGPGPTLHLGGGARLEAEVGSISLALVGRRALGDTGGDEGNGSEVRAGFTWDADTRFRVESLFGAGLRGAVGVPSWRVGLGVRYAWRPSPPPPLVLRAAPLAALELEPVPEAPETPPPGVAARVVRDQIVVDDPLNFVFGEATLLEASEPTLAAVARLLQDEPRIAYVVIEGHASEEGSFGYNYALSQARARAVSFALIEAGVDPRRLGTRAYGEVAPARLGEEGLPANRRVVFRIVTVLPAEAPTPAWDPTLRPWAEEAP